MTVQPSVLLESGLIIAGVPDMLRVNHAPVLVAWGRVPATTRHLLLSALPFVSRGWPSHQRAPSGPGPPLRFFRTKEPEFMRRFCLNEFPFEKPYLKT